MDLIRGLSPVVALGLVAALSTACGDGEELDPAVEITSHTDGDVVAVPFEVTVAASVELGPTDFGLHHVHVWFGDDEESYLVVEGTSVEINNAPEGEHPMHVSLRHADHSPAGADKIGRAHV